MVRQAYSELFGRVRSCSAPALYLVFHSPYAILADSVTGLDWRVQLCPSIIVFGDVRCNLQVMWSDDRIRQRMIMEGKTMWNEEKVKELIELYHQYNLLWDSRHPDFKNRAKKNEAIKEMGCLLNCESLEVERKIQVVLAQYRRTRLKLTNLKRAGASDEEMEKNLWYGYKLLRFLEERGLPDKGMEHDNYSTENPVVVLVDAGDFSELKEEAEEIEEHEEEIDHTMSTLVPQQITSERRGSKRPKNSFENREDDRFKIMANASSSVPTQKDEYSLFGEQLAFKLRKMEPILRLETQHKINCVVFDAEMKMAKKPDSAK